MDIKDLKDSKELSQDEMSKVAGGTATPANPLIDIVDIFAPSNQYGAQMSTAAAYTGPQVNGTMQDDSDVIVAGAGSQALNLGGNTADSTNVAGVTAISTPTNGQF